MEAVYAATHEGALRLEDVLTRRTRISIEERDRGVAAAPVVAGLLAPVLGWDTPPRRARGGQLPRAGGRRALGPGSPGRRGGERHPPHGPGAPAGLTQPIAAVAREHPGTHLTGEEQGMFRGVLATAVATTVLAAVPGERGRGDRPDRPGHAAGRLEQLGSAGDEPRHGVRRGVRQGVRRARGPVGPGRPDHRPAAARRLQRREGHRSQRGRGGGRGLDQPREHRAGHPLGRFGRTGGAGPADRFPGLRVVHAGRDQRRRHGRRYRLRRAPARTPPCGGTPRAR